MLIQKYQSRRQQGMMNCSEHLKMTRHRRRRSKTQHRGIMPPPRYGMPCAASDFQLSPFIKVWPACAGCSKFLLTAAHYCYIIGFLLAVDVAGASLSW
mmetsp:Transcript_53038/g.97070  ORF Transcript_53038/g.97070 Transcript_53038/m.97070 type:complete len:98 (+) Transcript_53038:634-927(+)